MQIIINDNQKLPKDILPNLPKDFFPPLNSSEKKYLQLLEFHDSFPTRILEAREKLGIKIDIDGKVILIIPDLVELSKITEEIVTELHIPAQLATCIQDIIVYGKVLTATHPINVFNIEHKYNRKLLYSPNIMPRPHKSRMQEFGTQVIENWYESNRQVLSTEGTAPAYPIIQINKRLDCDELKQAIEDHWNEIDLAMVDFEKSVPYFEPLQEINEEEFKYSMIIYRMRQQKPPVRHKKIYEYLQTQFEVDYKDAEQRVIQKYSDFRKLLMRLDFVKKV